MTISNARINNTFLGFEDHGIFTFILDVKYNEIIGQGIGMIALDDYNPSREIRQGTANGMQMIMDILHTVGVDSWEKLKGQYIRVEHARNSDRIIAIGHITENWWLQIGG